MSKRSDTSPTTETKPSKGICFVVMPFGRTTDEKSHFRGWYKQVIKSTIIDCGYEPFLSADHEAPNAIDDEIRKHLAFDAMVVADLGGMTPKDSPNPNVMYELGIRHAFGLPVVIMAWEEQELPFDINKQRTIMTQRGMDDIDSTKTKLQSYIEKAEDNEYYNPMIAVERHAKIESATQNLEKDSILGNLVDEVRELKGRISSSEFSKSYTKYRNLDAYLSKDDQAHMINELLALGFDSNVVDMAIQLCIDGHSSKSKFRWRLPVWIHKMTESCREIEEFLDSSTKSKK